MAELACCVDFGSTFTKAALVDLDDAELIATAAARTTLDTDVLDGWQACVAQLAEREPRAATALPLACSSAGGGLRIGVVGNEVLVTAEAGRRVALSSGGRVVCVKSGGLSEAGLPALAAAQPDVVLLVGGTDGGNAEVLVASAAALSHESWTAPVVVAGNIEVQEQVAELLAAGATPHVVTDNVVPRIGVLCPEPARAAIREMFVRHVIGGKHLSEGADFPAMVRGATPDVVLSAVELLARGPGSATSGVGDVVVVDVGGATTDVHSVVESDPEDLGLAREVVPTPPVSRTVEADLGMRWSAIGTVDAGQDSGLVADTEYAALARAAERRQHDPAYLPVSEADRRVDSRLATLAVQLATRRHAGRQQLSFGADGRVVEHSGKDLREVGLLVGSGGVLRHNGNEFALSVLASACERGESQGWLLPERPRVVVDHDYVLAPAGLLATAYPGVAWSLLNRLLVKEEAT